MGQGMIRLSPGKKIDYSIVEKLKRMAEQPEATEDSPMTKERHFREKRGNLISQI
jgi:hypothetical protein